jgi:murein L,D-transpeptidase YcbB/YkuD
VRLSGCAEAGGEVAFPQRNEQKHDEAGMTFPGEPRLARTLIAAAVIIAAGPWAARAEAPAAAVLAAAAPALGPDGAAFGDALARGASGWADAERADVLGFYAERGQTPYWTEAERGAALVAALGEATRHGLPPRYASEALAAALATADAGPEARAAAELAATRAYLAFARDLNAGVLVPFEVDPEIELRPARPDRAALLDRLGDGTVAATLAALEPTDPEYAALIAEKARLEAAPAADWGPAVPSGPTLRLGDAGPRVAALRARLAARGYAPPAEAPAAVDPAAFDIGLEAALRRFQGETGLEADGLAGARTIAALNEGPEARLKAVVVNLERLRWMNGRLGERYLYANIPDFSVRLVEGGATVFSARTVVGKAEDTRTPEFSDEMTYFVVNPTWHIPDSIAQRVYLPKLKANPNTLANSDMRIFTRAGTEIDPGLVDFTQFASGNFPFRIKQNPSQANALGRVKFMFPNQFSIYLHDTPSKGLFDEGERAFSNGCVRVEDPIALAELLLAGQADDPAAAMAEWLAAGAERTVTLERPIPVHLVYRTVFVDDDGRIRRRQDVYGRDAKVWRALEAAGVTLPAAQG